MWDLNSGVFQIIQFVQWKVIPNITGTNSKYNWYKLVHVLVQTAHGQIENFLVCLISFFFLVLISILYTYLMEGIRAILFKLTLTTYSRDAKTTGFSNFIRLRNVHY